jgi:hypothetical protein
MKPAYETVFCSRISIPTSCDLHFSDNDASNALDGFLTLWDPRILSFSSGLPNWCRPDDLSSQYSQNHSPLLVLSQKDEAPPPTVPEGSILVIPDSHGSTLIQLCHQAGIADSSTDLGIGNDHLYGAIGLGVLLIDGLFESQNHTNLLQRDMVWQSVSAALKARKNKDAASEIEFLKEAANHLVVARESLSSTNGNLIEFSEFNPAACEFPESACAAIGLPRIISMTGTGLSKLSLRFPELLAQIHDGQNAGLIEVIGGCQIDRPEQGMELSSILWNLEKGQESFRKLLGKPAKVHFRKNGLPSPALPIILRHFGFAHQVLPFERQPGTYPPSRSSVVSWSWGDSMGMESFSGIPLDTGSARDIFHVARRYSESISTDYTPILMFKNGQGRFCPAFNLFCHLSALAPVFGKFTSFESLFKTASAGDYWNESSAGEFGIATEGPDIRQSRIWLDAAMCAASLRHLISSESAPGESLRNLEDQIESLEEGVEPRTLALNEGSLLAERILKTGEEGLNGYLLINPSSFNRRVVVHLEGPDCLPIQTPVLACQPAMNENAKAVVEVPGFGFSWIPRSGKKGVTSPRQRWHLADERGVRNEFLEAEFDPATGGMRGLKDLRNRVPRLQQIIITGKGGSMLSKGVQIYSKGPALGELSVQGIIVDGQGKEVGKFFQTMRTWIGRPVLELETTVSMESGAAENPPMMRFSWKDASTEIQFSVLGQAVRLVDEKPVQTKYLHFTQGSHATTILAHDSFVVRRKGTRGIEIPLLAESGNTFKNKLGFAVDRDYPHLLSKGSHTPFLVIPVTKGPPSIGPTGWLMHMDSPSMMLERIRVDQANRISAICWECADRPATVSMTFAKPPQKAILQESIEEECRILGVENGMLEFDARRRGMSTVQVTPVEK